MPFRLSLPDRWNLSMSRSELISNTCKLVALSRSGSISAARNLFDEMVDRDTVAWNAMLTAYARSGSPHQSLSLFSAMRYSAARPDAFTLTALIAASADVPDLPAGRKLHALVVRLGLRSSLPVSNSLVDMYGKCSRPANAARVFDEMVERNEVSWCSLLFGYVNSGQLNMAHRVFDDMPGRNTFSCNILIAGYTRFGEAELSVSLFRRMRTMGLEADAMTLAGLINACSEVRDARCGRAVHAFICRAGWEAAVEVCNSVLSFYADIGCRDDASKIFETMGSRSQVSWNAMIDANMKAGDVCGAVSLFDRAPEKNAISWTSMVAGYARNGYGDDALKLFIDMTRELAQPDDFTFGAVLHACASLAVLENGRMVHSCVIQCGFESYVYVGNGLVNMYAKCGDFDCSKQVFDGMHNRDLVSWNAMLFGFALHGVSSRALEVFNDMVACGAMPDKVTFLGLLMACSHAGLIEQGKVVIEMMDSDHGVPLDGDHITCVVDMLGRAGHLREASKLLEGRWGMVGGGATHSCEALLSACAVQGDVSTGRKLGELLVSKEPDNEVGYVMLSNLYCVSGQWRAAEKLRTAMVAEGVKKAPGCSWIEVTDMIIAFVTGSESLVQMGEVHVMLGLLHSEMKYHSFLCSTWESRFLSI